MQWNIVIHIFFLLKSFIHVKDIPLGLKKYSIWNNKKLCGLKMELIISLSFNATIKKDKIRPKITSNAASNSFTKKQFGCEWNIFSKGKKNIVPAYTRTGAFWNVLKRKKQFSLDRYLMKHSRVFAWFFSFLRRSWNMQISNFHLAINNLQ